MSVQNFSFLARLEVAEKFVVVGWWSRPILGFSFSQAEQFLLEFLQVWIKFSDTQAGGEELNRGT